MDHSAKLVYNDRCISFENFRHSAEDAAAGSPYNTALDVRIISGSFSGYGRCECDIKNFKKFVAELQALYHFKRSTVDFFDICYGSELHIDMSKTGQLTLRGVLHGEEMLQSLTFEFNADQTVLPPFIAKLQEWIAYENNH